MQCSERPHHLQGQCDPDGKDIPGPRDTRSPSRAGPRPQDRHHYGSEGKGTRAGTFYYHIINNNYIYCCVFACIEMKEMIYMIYIVLFVIFFIYIYICIYICICIYIYIAYACATSRDTNCGNYLFQVFTSAATIAEEEVVNCPVPPAISLLTRTANRVRQSTRLRHPGSLDFVVSVINYGMTYQMM